jgi:hypothetical protein
MKPSLLQAVAALAAVATVTPARAERCGYSQPSWNVPRGGVVFTQGEGPIKAVLNAVGETRTHTMLNLGTGWVAHSTMYEPGQRAFSESGFCNAPVEVNQLRDGYPGASKIEVSAAYQFLSGSTTGVTYQRGKIFAPGTSLETDWGAAIAGKVSGFPGDFVSTDATVWGGPYAMFPDHYLRLLHPYGSGRPHSPYVLNQYRDLGGVNHGSEAWDTGMVCSTFISYGQHAYGQNCSGFGAPCDVAAHPYTHDQTNAAGYALYDSVKNGCETRTGFFGKAWDSLKSGVGCLDFDLCDEAAAQVRNCMAFGDCANGDPGEFDGYVSYPYFTSTSISPDWIGGWVTGQNYNGSDQSVWAWDWGHQVQFSSSGAVYDCWY